MTKIQVVIGTRPEAIKMAPVVRAAAGLDDVEMSVLTTGQHREMLSQTLGALEVQEDVALDVMQDRQGLGGLTSRLVQQLTDQLTADRPDVLLVQGDTTSAMTAALAAFYLGIPVGHVEAGLRSGRMDNPFPEEANRRLIAQLATWHFAPTDVAADNLAREGFHEGVHVVGNTVIDNLHWVLKTGRGASAFRTEAGRKVLVTMHRRENHGVTMARLSEAVCRLGCEADTEIVLPLHLNPAVREQVVPVLSGCPGVHLTEPLDYLDFSRTLAEAHLVLTDSGGVQEEAPSLGRPVLVLRTTTERPEGVAAGAAELVGTDGDHVYARAHRLLTDPVAYDLMARAVNPYGDGHAAQRILALLQPTAPSHSAATGTHLRPPAARRPADLDGLRAGPRPAEVV
jgi:UDP-N-acetylglucosamine 2-epimerase (non-hydrolysing)